MMNRLILLLIWIQIVSSCTLENNNKVPKIDKSKIKVEDLLWDLDQLQQVPDFEYIDSTSKVREILFQGPTHNGKETKVFAYYSNPDILKTGSNQGNKFPGVVLISGGSQPAMSEWVERWAHEGYAAITCDYGNTRMSEVCGPAPNSLEERLAEIYDSISNGPKAVRAFRTASISILTHSLLLGFPEVEKNKTAVTGISWGGFQTCIVSGIDNRFKAAAPVYGCAFHDEIIFKRYLDENMTEEGKALWLSKIDPKNYLSFSQCPTLFINGNKDGCFDIIPFNKTTQLISEKNRHIRITPNMGHDHHAGWRPREIALFFNSIFTGGVPLPKITGIEKTVSKINFNYKSSVSLKNARFYYSNDTTNSNAERIWHSIPAKIFDDKVESNYPEEEFYMGFLYITDNMELGISSELITQ